MGQASADVVWACIWLRWFALLTMLLMARLSPSKMIACSLTFQSLSSACCLVSLAGGGEGGEFMGTSLLFDIACKALPEGLCYVKMVRGFALEDA